MRYAQARGPPAPVYKLLAYRRRKGEAKGFTWADYRELRAIPAR